MSDLQDALDLHDSIVRHVPDDKEWADHVKPIVEAARRVANLDRKAIKLAICPNCPDLNGSHDAAVDRVFAALGITEDE